MNATDVPSDRFHIHILAFAALGPGVSGGDKIFMDCARVWLARGHRITAYVTEEGSAMLDRYGLTGVERVVLDCARWMRIHFAVHYLVKTLRAILFARTLRLASGERHVVFSAGDSPPDVFPAWALRRRHPMARWAAAFYFFAAPPWPSRRDEAYRGGRLPVTFRSVAWFLLQQMTYPLIRRGADFVVVCNQLDVERMAEDGVPASRTWPIYGGIDLDGMKAIPEPTEKTWDACFVGRFHAQKGVLPLLDLWAKVVREIPRARLAIIGEGSLRSRMEARIAELHLGANAEILGYLDGEPKGRVLKASRLFLHPPTHDTGGMAAAEAMGCGLPVVGFDLPGYLHCYPRGMRKVPVGNLDAFAAAVVALLKDDAARNALAREAAAFARGWNWPCRAARLEEIFASLFRGEKTCRAFG